jgi:hypothetical protein
MLLRYSLPLLVLSLAVSMPARAADSAPATPAAAPAQAPAALPPLPAAPADASSSSESTEPASETVTYLPPSWGDMLHAAVRFNALDLHDDNLIDEYAAVTDCEIYKFYFKDDFKWQEVRRRIRESAEMNSAHYPTHFYAQALLSLGRYDFDKKIFDFTPETAIHKVNLFDLYTYKSITICTDKVYPKYIPREFQALSSTSFTLTGIPLTPAEAQSLLRMMNADKNTDRQIIVRFDMTVTYVARLVKQATNPGTAEKEIEYIQNGLKTPGIMRLDVRVDSIEFFEDQAMTKLIYSTKPEP